MTQTTLSVPHSPPAQSLHPADRPLRTRQRLRALVIGAATFGLFRLLSEHRGLAEVVYGNVVGQGLGWALAWLTALIPVSLTEPLVAALVAALTVRAARAVREVIRGQRRWQNAAASGALLLGRDAGIAVTLFYLLWGFNYARPSVADRLGLPAAANVSAPEVAALVERLTLAANRAYEDIHKVSDVGEPTRLAGSDCDLRAALGEGWRRVNDELGQSIGIGASYPGDKPFIATPIVRRLGIHGVFVPFTGEALILGDLPAVLRPRAAAHEQAHQRGIVVEGEASFLGYLVAARAPCRLANYSAFVFAQRQMLSVLAGLDAERARAVQSQLFPGVRRDIADANAYARRYRGLVSRTVSRANDAYLKSNTVREGAASYFGSVALLVTYARLHGGPTALAP